MTVLMKMIDLPPAPEEAPGMVTVAPGGTILSATELISEEAMEDAGVGSIYRPNIDGDDTEKRMKAYKAVLKAVLPWPGDKGTPLKKYQIAPEKKEKTKAKYFAESVVRKGANVDKVFIRSKSYVDFNLKLHRFPKIVPEERSPAYERIHGPGKPYHPPPLATVGRHALRGLLLLRIL